MFVTFLYCKGNIKINSAKFFRQKFHFYVTSTVKPVTQKAKTLYLQT
ncbi:TPA_asm: hypothetical protein [Porphyromonas phage phage030a_KCOM2803]|uniref:Uncharacterized protein n=1 Tax=Porphyromonas phage phage030a_KCOM2803 TaxID=3154120 RepID=A0AAT9JET4_9CAUD